jgi:hypothetical protein
VEEALLDLRIIDPACGSGHFLLAAARRVAEVLANTRCQGAPMTADDFQMAMHDVVSHCIYGVDLNPMAVELVRMNLWLEGYYPGKPLSFLDHHIQTGNSLVGLMSPDPIRLGIPDDAFKCNAGDDSTWCNSLRKSNAASRKLLTEGQLFLSAQHSTGASSWATMPEDTPAQIRAKSLAFKKDLSQRSNDKVAVQADLWVGAFLLPKSDHATVPTSELLNDPDSPLLSGQDKHAVFNARAICQQNNVFHWFIRFPDIFDLQSGHGGFDCVLGNPPWETIRLAEEEFFATRNVDIAKAVGNTRKKYIQLLSQGQLNNTLADAPELPPNASEIALFGEYQLALQAINVLSDFAHTSAQVGGRYPLSGEGGVNMYALFAELFSQIRHPKGRASFLTPTGFATDASVQVLFRTLIDSHLLQSLYGFVNKRDLFPAVDDRYAFCLITLAPSHETDFAFYLEHPNEIDDERRHFTLYSEDFQLINPNTGTCPLFRSKEDAELCKKFYRKAPILVKEAPDKLNPWKVQFGTLFHMTAASKLFLKEPQEDTLPLYEGKMVHLYDPHWATYELSSHESPKVRDVTLTEKQNPEFEITPQYWIKRQHVLEKLATSKGGQGRPTPKWFLGFRDIARATDERTMICSFIPFSGVGNKLPLIIPLEQMEVRLFSCLAATLASLIFDYIPRLKVGGASMNFHYVKQFPVLPPEAFRPEDVEFLSSRVLELTYTSESMRPWAEDMGYRGDPFPWDEDRRAQLKAEIDARIAHLYGLTRKEVEYILDPETLYPTNCPTVTFPGLKNKELKVYGEYRTQRLLLAAYDADTSTH